MTAEAAASRAPAGEAGFRLLASRRQLAEAQRIAQVGSWEWELDGDEATLSDEVARILGLPPGSRLHMRDLVARFVHPADLDRVLAHMERLPTDPTPFTLEHRIVRSDGAVRSVLVRGEGVVDEDGRVVADVAHFGLIAMRERVEAKLPLTDPAEGSGA